MTEDKKTEQDSEIGLGTPDEARPQSAEFAAAEAEEVAPEAPLEALTAEAQLEKLETLARTLELIRDEAGQGGDG